ncbi:MAG: hypothetical protein ABSB74_00635 [Tepidisphaeraceae bacterium]
MRWAFATAAALLSLAWLARVCPAATPPAATQPASTQAMQKKIQDLQARIDALESHPAKPRCDPADVMGAIVDDADRRSQLLSTSPAPMGYDPNVGFIIQSDDGAFSLHPSLLLQARYSAEDRNRILPGHGGITGKQGDDTKNGFEITRLRLSVDGNALTPLLNYYVLVADDAEMSQAKLLDAYVMYRVSAQSPLAVKLGQFKDPLWHERNLLPSRLMAVDRSLVDSLIGGGQTNRVQGGAMIYDQDRLRGEIGVDDGYNGGNDSAYGAAGSGAVVGAGAGLAPTDWGAFGRGEYLAIGERAPEINSFYEYDQFSARGDKQNILVLGGGFDYSESGANKILFHTVDAQFNTTSGWAFYGAYLGAYRNLYTNRGVSPGSYYDSGLLLQAAYLVTTRFEPFIRWDYTHLDGRAEPGIIQDNIDEISIGANYYLYGQTAKITIDGSWLPNGSPTDVNYLDILQNNSHNEFLLRAQFQLAI